MRLAVARAHLGRLRRLGVLWRLRLEQVPVGLVGLREPLVGDVQRVVGLRAQARVGPVRAAGEHLVRRVAGRRVDDELVVADVAALEHPVGHIDPVTVQPGARVLVGVVAVGSLTGVRQHERDPVGRVEQADQLGVVELVDRAVAGAAVVDRADQERGQRLDLLAGEAAAERVADRRDVGEQRGRARAAIRALRQRVHQVLRRQDAAVEVRAEALGALRCERDLRGLEPQVLARREVSGRADHRHDLVVVRRPGGSGQIAPRELLHRPLLGGLRLPVLVRLALEPDPGGQRGRRRLARALAVDGEAEAVVDRRVVAPGEKGDVVVAQHHRLVHEPTLRARPDLG